MKPLQCWGASVILGQVNLILVHFVTELFHAIKQLGVSVYVGVSPREVGTCGGAGGLLSAVDDALHYHSRFQAVYRLHIGQLPFELHNAPILKLWCHISLFLLIMYIL